MLLCFFVWCFILWMFFLIIFFVGDDIYFSFFVMVAHLFILCFGFNNRVWCLVFLESALSHHNFCKNAKNGGFSVFFRGFYWLKMRKSARFPVFLECCAEIQQGSVWIGGNLDVVFAIFAYKCPCYQTAERSPSNNVVQMVSFFCNTCVSGKSCQYVWNNCALPSITSVDKSCPAERDSGMSAGKRFFVTVIRAIFFYKKF